MPKRTVEEEIESFLEVWDGAQLVSFLEDIIPLIKLYDVDEDNDWVQDIVGSVDVRNVRLVRTVYLLSMIAERHSGKFSAVRIHHRELYKRLETFAGVKHG